MESEQLIQTLSHLDRQEVEAFVEVAIGLLDMLDGDPDLEPNGDELDGTGAEDDFGHHNSPSELQGAGCPIADPDIGIDDQEADDEREPEEACEEFSDPAARAIHRRRIQRTRCVPRFRYRRDWRTGEIISREVIRYELGGGGLVPTRRSLLKRKRGVPRYPRP